MLSVVLALLLLLSEIAHDMHEISPDNVNRQSREEVVRSNGMIFLRKVEQMLSSCTTRDKWEVATLTGCRS